MTKEQIKKDFLVSIGSVIKKKREKKNISQQELGEYLNVSKSTISRYESGSFDMPATTLPLISSYCDFPLSDYVYDEKVKTATRNFEMLLRNTIDDEEATELTKEQNENYQNMINKNFPSRQWIISATEMTMYKGVQG
uniref:helix-turn-helix domain-containing protein n=1 Tax=Acetatifactor sp. TaxID=1872090 RepID=UPI004057C6EB